MSPAGEGAYEAKAVRCHSCAEQASKAETFAERPANEKAGLFFTSTRRHRPT